MQEVLIGFEPCRGAHTGADLAKIVIQRLHHFGLWGRVIAFTTDNASNNYSMSKAVNAAVESLCKTTGIKTEIALCPCISHIIQLGSNSLLTDIKIRPTKDQLVKNWLEDEAATERALAQMQIPLNVQRGVSSSLVVPW